MDDAQKPTPMTTEIPGTQDRKQVHLRYLDRTDGSGETKETRPPLLTDENLGAENWDSLTVE